MSQPVLCHQCKKVIKTTNYVKCFNCNMNYHFSSCSPLSESTYLSMCGERRTSWKCQNCKPRSRSPNTMYQTVVHDDDTNKKQARCDDEMENEQAKKFKESESLTPSKTRVCSQSDIEQFNIGLQKVNTAIEELSSNVNILNSKITGQIQNTLTTITDTLSTLVTQVKELTDKDKQKEMKINIIETRMDKMEQQMLNRNIEIKNITNKLISEYEVVKTIGESLKVTIDERDINRAYRTKRSEKIIVEFTTLNKKTEFMDKIKNHRVDANIIKENGNNKYIYINDELTFSNRRLLWLAKTKAKEANWKFVWVKHGNIFARKNENSPLFVINNSTDIDNINNAF
ncbi:uncharacterized protein LOC119604445 [Lucilia sericata]|uniref:uncharacterized protein LOC119604445 n=1 Tax=Lucilia sericata TaxID=13632 RepID=UPI0018A83E46|nr:uncharacterized protein LOC119604445 [Lucilia sericata]